MRAVSFCMVFIGLVGCASNQPIAPGEYCLVEPLMADAGRETFFLGDFAMRVRVAVRGGESLVTFSNSMPDSQEILHVEASVTMESCASTSSTVGATPAGELSPHKAS
jgi:hypothetical protein